MAVAALLAWMDSSVCKARSVWAVLAEAAGPYESNLQKDQLMDNQACEARHSSEHGQLPSAGLASGRSMKKALC